MVQRIYTASDTYNIFADFTERYNMAYKQEEISRRKKTYQNIFGHTDL